MCKLRNFRLQLAILIPILLHKKQINDQIQIHTSSMSHIQGLLQTCASFCSYGKLQHLYCKPPAQHRPPGDTPVSTSSKLFRWQLLSIQQKKQLTLSVASPPPPFSFQHLPWLVQSSQLKFGFVVILRW